MFKFSSKTVVDRKFKITDLYKQMSASKEARKDGTLIESVVLKNVLSPSTLYCDAEKSIKEIYVFEITVKERYVPEHFIKELDGSIKLHTLFIVKHEDYELSMLSYKLGTQKGKYWQTNWENNDDFDVPLVSDVPEMYKFILSKFLTYPPFDSETVDEYVKRHNQLAKLDFQIGKTESAIAHESQSKKRFEYNARLKEYKSEKENLLKENVK